MLLAVHLSDGVLIHYTLLLLLGGFLLAAGLVALAFPLRDEDIPRTALLTAVFFVASLLHVKFGGTSVHLLLTGLMGVILGRRAGLAIVLGLLLQAALLGHGGFTTLGINAVVMTVPAFVAGGLFALLNRLPAVRQPWFRALLVMAGVLVWVLTLVFGVAVLWTNPWTTLLRPNVGPGFHVDLPDFTQARSLVLHPLTLSLAVVLAGATAWMERRLGNVPEFPLGFLLGVVSVLLTAALNALVLLVGGVNGWHTVVTVVFLAHLPLAILEGVILGFVVGFLARVKPNLLGLPEEGTRLSVPYLPGKAKRLPADSPLVPLKPPALLLAIAAILALATPVQAHRLEASYKVLSGQRVLVESWFETGDSPKNAIVKVYRKADGTLLSEGPLDPVKGTFTFSYSRQEDLSIVVNAPGGHRAEVTIWATSLPITNPSDPSRPDQTAHPPASQTSGTEGSDQPTQVAKEKKVIESGLPVDPTEGGTERRSSVSYRDVISGLAFVLALGGFALSVRNQQHLAELRRLLTQQRSVSPESTEKEYPHRPEPV
jgi:cobalt/nickel transport system permease protein